MKRKNLLVFLTAACLFGCQQQDNLQDPSKEAIDLSTSIDNQSITDLLTRNSAALSLPVKNSFSTGDVISMSVSNQDYLPFALGVDSQTWDEIDTDVESVTFYAHYPELTDEAATRALGKRYRSIKGGKEHLFGIAQAIRGTKNVALKFKRMTVPVILLDEDGRPYNGKASIKLRLRNRGIQDLFNGKVELDKSAEAEDINIKKVSDGELTNLIPQETIKAGEVIGEVSIEGEKQKIVANQDVEVSAGNAIVMRFARNRVIFDGHTPLRR